MALPQMGVGGSGFSTLINSGDPAMASLDHSQRFARAFEDKVIIVGTLNQSTAMALTMGSESAKLRVNPMVDIFCSTVMPRQDFFGHSYLSPSFFFHSYTLTSAFTHSITSSHCSYESFVLYIYCMMLAARLARSVSNTRFSYLE